MFGQNEIVGRKFFADAPPESLLVTSIFFTLQGEGPLAGRPAVFLRLAKCNLDCSFCDTYFDAGTWMTFKEIRDRMVQAITEHFAKQQLALPGMYFWDNPDDDPYPIVHPGLVLVVTGGEPTLQSNLGKFIEQDFWRWGDIQIETNGLIDLEMDEDSTIVVVSPKCSEKSGHYLKPTPLMMRQAHAYKFVLSADPSSPYHSVPDWALAAAADGQSVYVSPMNVYQAQPKEMKIALMLGKEPSLEVRSEVIERVSFWEPGLLNLEANQANHEYAAQYAMNNGLILNLQMHLYASIP